ncbi:hypothetical protein [Xanthovirga aplysinae]|nr:hypothetical protein [Xanthovirga aplysinae]
MCRRRAFDTVFTGNTYYYHFRNLEAGITSKLSDNPGKGIKKLSPI